MEKKTTSTLNFALCFSVASAWFGTHCGSGFATGAQATSFWTTYGAYAFFLPIISVAVMAVYAFVQWEVCRLYGTYNYRAFANSLFHPYEKVFGTIYELLFIAIMVMGVSAVFAGAGQLVADGFGIPYTLSVALVMALVVILTMFGSKLLLRAASILSTILIVVIVGVCLIGIVKSSGSLAQIASEWPTNGSLWKAILSGILYGSFQCLILGSTTNLVEEIDSSKNSLCSAIVGFFMNGIVMVALTYLLLCYYPEINSETLPVLVICQQLGIPYIDTIYSVMLFLAFMTTAITCIGSLVTRVEGFGAERIKNTTTRRAIYSLAIILICFCIAQFGLLTIIKKGYTAVGYLGIPFAVIPVLTIGVKKIIDKRKEEAAGEAVEVKEEA